MRRHLLALTAATTLFGLAFDCDSQSQIQFQNSGGTATTYNDGVTRVFGPAGTYTYGLYLGAYGSTALSQLTLVDTVASPSAPSSASGFAGIINHGTVDQGNVPHPGIGAIAVGTQYAFMIGAWSSIGGSSYDAAVTSALNNGTILLTVSGLGFVTPTTIPNGSAQLFGSSPGQLSTGLRFIIPEPSILTLGGLGVAVLLFFRHRRTAR